MLMDKGYYDYDYSEVEKKEERKLVTVEETKKSNEEVMSALAAFGWGRKAQTKNKALSAGELQELVIKDIQTQNKGGK